MFYLVEIFSAIQGSGVLVGQRHIFIRFLGCHIKCAFCDTPATHENCYSYTFMNATINIVQQNRSYYIQYPVSQKEFVFYCAS